MRKNRFAFCLLVGALCVAVDSAFAADNAAPADELARRKAPLAVDIPQAPPAYRRPSAWKPLPYADTLAEIANKHSAETMARAKKALFTVNEVNAVGHYQATGKSLDAHPCPEWFTDAKLGIFIDWGPWSVASWCPYVKGQRLYPDWYELRCRKVPETKRYHEKNWGKDFKSDDLIDLFRGERFNAPELMALFAKCGARYVVPFLKHHGGFCLWDCSYTFRDSVDRAAHRDFAREMADACRRNGLKFGFYTSQAGEWEYPILQDDGTLKTMTDIPDRVVPYNPEIERTASGKIAVRDFVRDYIIPQTVEFIDKYDPDILWYDFDWTSYAHLNGSYDITAYFYNRAEGRKEVACNDRFGKAFPKEIEGRFTKRPRQWLRTVRGDFYTDEWGDTEECLDPKKGHPWESCSGISKSYGNHWMENFDKTMVMTDREFVIHFVDIVARGGNLLLLVNLDGQGALPEVQRERLEQIGRWLKRWGEAIYATRLCAPYKTDAIAYTQAKDGRTVYAIVKKPAAEVVLECELPVGAKVRILGETEALTTRRAGRKTIVTVPGRYAASALPFALSCEKTVAAKGRAIVLAERGRNDGASIVIPAKATESQLYAARELQTHTERLTGVKLPIVTDEKPLPPKAILLGETRHTSAVLGAVPDLSGLGEDGFRLVAKPPHLIVLGSNVRGCLYGVYEILERFGGCRWYASWHTVVPERQALAVPADLDFRSVPDFVMRANWWYDVIVHNDFAARQRVNTRPWGAMEAKYGGNCFRFCRDLQSCHTFNTLIPPEKYMKDHPDYFSGTGARVQPCLTHPDVLAIVISNVLAHVRRDPTAKVYGVSQNDWYNYCTCPRCKKVDEEEGSHAGTMVRFVNAVAEAVEKEFPGKIIETLAYQYTRRPPTKTRLRKNVVPCLCSIECDFALPIAESKFAQNRSFCEDIRKWSPMTDQLYVWDYVTNFRHYPAPFPNCFVLQENLKFFRDFKTKEMFPEGAYQGNLADFAELKAWLLSKWMWNADLPMKPLLDDFFEGHYGKAAPFVRDYFEKLHSRQIAHSQSGKKPLLIFEELTHSAFDGAFWDWAAERFARAERAVANEPPVFGRAVRATAFSVDYVRFMHKSSKEDCLVWLSREKPCEAERENLAALAKKMCAVMEEAAPARLSESLSTDKVRKEKIRTAAKGERGRFPAPADRGFVEEKDLHYCHTPAMGGLKDDPLAEDGRALWLSNTHYEWSTAFPMTSVRFDPGVKLRLRVRCRVERKAGRTGEAFWAGVYDWSAKRGACAFSLPVEKIGTDGYVWYDVGTFVPQDAQTVWIGPGRFGKDGKSNIGGLWVDKIELSLAEKTTAAGKERMENGK